MLVDHLKKGDMRDVAILAMMPSTSAVDCAALLGKVGFCRLAPTTWAPPESGGMIEIVVYGETDNIDSKCEDVMRSTGSVERRQPGGARGLGQSARPRAHYLEASTPRRKTCSRITRYSWATS